jgi:(R,R)-butanediol dehydrogenase / meso-butanediol dehydrogenase / diacetyl reductase
LFDSKIPGIIPPVWGSNERNLMKAAVWHGQQDVRVEDVEEPNPGPHAVKIEVAWCGISGTDIHEYEAGPILIAAATHQLTGRQAPVVMGHEFSGVVVGVGGKVTSFSAGDRLTRRRRSANGRWKAARSSAPGTTRGSTLRPATC